MAKDAKSFLRHALTYGGGTLLLQAASVLLLPLYTRYLSPAEFGVLDVLNRLGEVLCICLMVNGISKAAVAFYRQAEDEEDRARTAATLTLFLAAILGGIGLLVVPLAGGAGEFFGMHDSALLTFGVLTALLQATTAIPLALMQSRLESGAFTWANISMFVMRVSLTILAVVGLGWGLWGILAASALTSAVAGGLLTMREFTRGSWRPNLRRIPEMARYAIPFVPAGLFWFLLYYADRFFLLRWSGQEELGLYALGARLAEAVGAFSIVPLQRVWSAEMFDAFERPDAPVIVGRIFTRLLGVYLFVGLGLCLLKDEVIHLLGSDRYAGAGVTVSLLVLAHYFSNASNLLDAAFYVRRQTHWKAWLNCVGALITVTLFVWLIPIYGATGAAGALLVGSIFYAAITFLVSQRVFSVRYEPVRVSGTLILAIIVYLGSQLLGTGATAIPGKLLLWASWPVLLIVLRLVTAEEKRYAMDTWHSALARLRVPVVEASADAGK